MLARRADGCRSWRHEGRSDREEGDRDSQNVGHFFSAVELAISCFGLRSSPSPRLSLFLCQVPDRREPSSLSRATAA